MIAAPKNRSSKRRNDSPVYSYMEETYGARFEEAKTFSDSQIDDCAKTQDSLNDKCIALYKMKDDKWNLVTNQIGAEEQEKRHTLINENAITPMDSYLWIKAVVDSISQRAMPAAGKSLEDNIQYLLKMVGMTATRIGEMEDGTKPDLVLTYYQDSNGNKTAIPGLWRISCKGTYRDKENDKDNEIQICYRSELSRKVLRHFAKTNRLLIIILPEYREKTRAFLAKHKIDLVVYDLDSGIIELKRRLQNA